LPQAVDTFRLELPAVGCSSLEFDHFNKNLMAPGRLFCLAHAPYMEHVARAAGQGNRFIGRLPGNPE
jgi:hypothetical protein